MHIWICNDVADAINITSSFVLANFCVPQLLGGIQQFNINCMYLKQHWAEFVRQVDPDILTGYNIQNFDLTYLLNRAKHLKLSSFAYLGRVCKVASVVRSQVGDGMMLCCS